MTSETRRPRFTIASLVNDETQYAAMQASFRAFGFAEPDAEFVAARGARSAFAALNALIGKARGDYVILCHQDVRLIADDRGALEGRLAELDRRDPNWALAGNAGAVAPGRLAMSITDPHGRGRRLGDLPARVMSLDENFIVLRRTAGVRFSADLDGFHLYGADICLVADVLGHSAWVIDFHLEHLSPGRKDASFHAAEAQFRAKWRRALRPRWMQTTCTLLRLSGNAQPRVIGPMVERLARVVTRRLSTDGGWTRPRPAANDADRPA
ncbi:MAG: hypothetical protein JSS20_11195 [Proteobacteria bacterium]|nr:hypothetical protein [Pseudomonadota bacterium]